MTSQAADGLLPTCEVVSAPADIEALRADWTALLARSARPELALSPHWLLTWWNVFGSLDGRSLQLGGFRDGGRLVGLAPLVRRRRTLGLLPFRRLEFLATGEPPEHGIYSNHLSLLAEAGAEEAVTRRFVLALKHGLFGDWDELVLAMMSHDTPFPRLLARSLSAAGYPVEVAITAGAPYIPLPGTWDEYLASLSANARRNIVRSQRTLEEWAGTTLRLESADDGNLERGKEVLIALHHGRWAREHESGVFRSPLYLRFHDLAMAWLAQEGLLELHWLVAHGEPIAALYGMRWGEKVYAYQMGRRTDLPPHLRPGAVLVALTIRRAIEQGRQEFDLQADESFYKFQFASHSRKLLTLRAARPTLTEAFRRIAVSARDAFR